MNSVPSAKSTIRTSTRRSGAHGTAPLYERDDQIQLEMIHVEGEMRHEVESWAHIGQEGGDPQGLAVLLVEKDVPPDTIVLKLNQGTQASAGNPVTMIGFPRIAGTSWAVTKGEVVGRKAKAIVFSGAVDEGSSGGPLIKDNQVIGVVTEATERFAYAVPTVDCSICA